MTHRSRKLLRSYQTALSRYLGKGQAASLGPALALGRQAVRLGIETLDLALIHERALIAQALPAGSSSARAHIIKRAGFFFAEAILPMEETHRSALEDNIHLNRLNHALNQRTLDLATSNRQLRTEVAKRKVVEQTLRRSEQRSSRLLDQSRRLQEQLRHLSRRILSAQEEERKRISRELHDVIAQVLTSINLRLAVLKTDATANTSGIAKSIARTQKMVEKSVGIVHRFAYDLRPAVLDYLGLIPAIQSLMKDFAKKTGMRVTLTGSEGMDKLDNSRRTVLYRVAQEALTNVSRHAQASRAEVNIHRLPNAIRIQIKDNGRSFNAERTLRAGKGLRMGLLGMRERVEMVGGKFTIESAPGRGTVVSAQIPFNHRTKELTRP